MNIEKLYPECKDNLWGGTRLKEKYGKQTDKNPCAESWELSFHPDGMTRFSDGTKLADRVTPEDLGKNATAFPFFPMLIKFIDAQSDLSVQVHPSDDYALARENSYGKTEMWYIVEADEGAGLYLGFNRDTDEKTVRAAIADGKIMDLMNFYPVHPGDVYMIPSGTIHAIGKGCLLCEIQQNSNLTYRVYDYGRRDQNGNLRELHVEKALRVMNYQKYVPTVPDAKTRDGVLLGINRYFTVNRQEIAGETALKTDSASFRALSCVAGSGTVGDLPMRAGDTYFLPAKSGTVNLKGEMSVITSSVRTYYLGIDLGGTFIKGGVVNDLGELLLSDKIPTEVPKGDLAVAGNIAKLCESLMKQLNLTAADIQGIGIGVPGMVDSRTGEVVYNNNLGWEHFQIAKTVEKLTGISVKIANDANVAALGEARFGSGKNYRTTVMLTLGTGVGGGIVLDGKLYEGNRSAGAEMGHTVMVFDGEPCTCGRRGCFEAYASATALIRDTKRAMQAHKESKLWEIATEETVDGATAFKLLGKDATADAVVDQYIRYLACGIANIANEFRPEAIILGGGICAEGERLTKPLQKLLDGEIYGGKRGPVVSVLTAELGNRAGILGAAALFLD